MFARFYADFMLWRNSRASLAAPKPARAVEQNLQRKQYLGCNATAMTSPSACLIRAPGYPVQSHEIFAISKWLPLSANPPIRTIE